MNTMIPSPRPASRIGQGLADCLGWAVVSGGTLLIVADALSDLGRAALG